MAYRNIFLVMIAGFVFTACDKDKVKNLSDELADLKKVAFQEVPQTVIKSTPTGRVVTVGVENKKETWQTVKRSVRLNPVEVISSINTDVIYPGSVLRGDSFMEGGYDPVVIQNPKEIVLSVTLQGVGLPVKTNSLPTVSNVRQQLNNLIKNNENKIDYKNVPSYMSYLSNEVSSTESFNKTFKIHAKANVLRGLVQAHFNYDVEEKKINDKKYVLIKVRQTFYNIAVDPKRAEDWGTLVNIGDYEPVYISSVDYGRVAHLLIETNESSSYISEMVKAGVDLKFSAFSASVLGNYAEVLKKLFKDNKVKVMTLGGPLEHSKVIKNYESFVAFLEKPTAKDLVASSAPIGYKVRTLKDNKEVDVYATFTEQILAYE